MRANATIIGAFVLGAIVLLVAGILFFGSGTLLQKRIPIVSFFHGSVAGLQVGAPVTFRGVPVGEVKAIGIRIDPTTRALIIQVDMRVWPDKVAVYGPRTPDDKLIPALVAQGVAAQLARQSFVTGLLNVDLDFRPGVPAFRFGGENGVAEVPTIQSEYDALTKKLEDVDIEGAIRSVQRTLGNLDAVLTTPELKQAIKDLPGAVTSIRHAAQTIDREVTQLSRSGRDDIASSTAALRQTLASVQSLATDLDRETASTLGRANTAIDATNAVLDPNGRTMIQAQRAIDDIAATAARLRNFVDRVDRDPSILIRGR
jgi:paraquat-inducible protein B